VRGILLRAIRRLLVLSILALPAAPLCAHGIVGNRMFIEPLFTEDANVKNELDLPAAEFLVQPDGSWRAIGFSFEKTLYPHRFSFILEDARLYTHANGRRLAGWDNLDLGLKWEAYKNARHEFVLSPALFLTLPTGSTGVTERATALQPMILYGKGFGDLAPGWLRPFAIQADFGYRATVTGPRDRDLVYDGVLMYSIPYLNHWVRHADAGYSLEHSLRRGLSPGAFFGDLFPFAEFNGTSPVQGAPGGTSTFLRPGILWMGKYAQVSLAADIPLRGPGLAAHRHAGFVILADWFLDDIIPGIGWTPFGHRRHHHDHHGE
jgi:hypothetical protein